MTKAQTAKPDSPAIKQPAAIAKVGITLNGREYIVSCDAGEEKKLGELVKLVDDKLKEVASRGASASETRLFMLTCLLLADELIESRRTMNEQRKADESLMVAAVDHLRDRIVSITEQVGR